MTHDELTCLSYWYPKIKDIVPTPKTEIIHTDCDLVELLDGEVPGGFEGFLLEMGVAINKIGLPVFLRTGLFSNKHDWRDSCHLTCKEDLPHHIYNIVEGSHLVDIMGLNTDVWVVREMLPVKPYFYAFKDMPIVQEFRYFVCEGKVTHRQPYWIPGSIKKPSIEDFEDFMLLLNEMSILNESDYKLLTEMTIKIGKKLGGYWSVDWLMTDNGWYLTDMAEGERSFKWYPEVK